MRMFFRLLPLLAATGLLALGLAACGGDDDPSSPPPAAEVDTVAPLVRFINPSYMDRTVAADEDIVVFFTEAMDTESVDVTVPGGGALTFNWADDDHYLRVAHDAAWNPGEKVTVTVGTGMKDLAGNALPQTFSTTFYVHSPDLMLLDTMFLGGQDAVLLNGEIVLFFSERMDLTSFSTSTTIAERAAPPKAVPGLRYGTWNGDTWTVTFMFDGVPDPDTDYRITVDGTTARTYDGDLLGDDLVIDFTTGSVADETGPQILSVTPAVGAVAPAGTDRIVVTFTEPVDPERTTPTEMSAILEMFMACEPAWNAAGDELTVYLQQPLPAGIRLYAVWDDYDLYDLAGNGNAAADSLSFTVAGEPDPFPVREDLKLYYSYSDDDFSGSLRQNMENVSGSAFDRVLRSWNAGSYSVVFETMGMAKTSSAVRITNMDMAGGRAACSPPVDFLRLPVTMSDSWSGQTSVTAGDTEVVLDFEATVGDERHRSHWSTIGKKAPSGQVWLDDCFDLTIVYTMREAGETSPFETGEMAYRFAPGLGIVDMWFAHETWEGPTRVGDAEGDYYLWGASIDDRYDIDD